MPRPNREPLHTVAEVAERLNCSTKTVRRLVDRGQLPSVNPTGDLLRIPRDAVDRLIAQAPAASQQGRARQASA